MRVQESQTAQMQNIAGNKMSPAELVQALADVTNKRDVDGIVKLMLPGYQGDVPFLGQKVNGTADVRKHWTFNFSQWKTFKAEVKRTLVDGNNVATQQEWTGTDQKGTPFKFVGVIMFTIDAKSGLLARGDLFLAPPAPPAA